MRYSLNASQVAPALTGEVTTRSRHRSRMSLADARAQAQSHSNSAFGGSTNNALVSEARKYIGTNPTGRGSLWCGAFMDMVLKRTGHAGGGNLASAYQRYGTRVSGPQVGAIAVMGRHGGGHVGVVSGVDAERQSDHRVRQSQSYGRGVGLSAPAASTPMYCPAADRRAAEPNNAPLHRDGRRFSMPVRPLTGSPTAISPPAVTSA